MSTLLGTSGSVIYWVVIVAAALLALKIFGKLAKWITLLLLLAALAAYFML